MKDIFSNLPTMVMSILQKVQTMNSTPLSCVDPQFLLTIGNPLLASSSLQAPRPMVMASPPHPMVSPASVLESQPGILQSSVLAGIQSPRLVEEPGVSWHGQSKDVALPSA